MPHPITSHKTCSRCNQSKPLDAFGKCPGYKDGYRGQCTPCRTELHVAYIRAHPEKRPRLSFAASRRQRLKYRYGLTEADYALLLEKQNGQCAICRRDSPGGRWGKVFHVDHCHKTRKVRGLLCHKCNSLLGHLGDSLESLIPFVRYLEDSERSG